MHKRVLADGVLCNGAAMASTRRRPTRRDDRPLPGQRRLLLGVPENHSTRTEYRRCGRPNCSKCADGGQGHGPYLYAVWREGARVRRKYLGPA